MPEVVMWTDGSCDYKTKLGGYGVLVIYPDGKRIELHGRYSNTTSNRMEIRAALEGLKSLPDNQVVTVYSDSEYLINSANGWAERWSKQNWRGVENQPIKNVDMWVEFLAEKYRHKLVRCRWVKGHSDIAENEYVHALANMDGETVEDTHGVVASDKEINTNPKHWVVIVDIDDYPLSPQVRYDGDLLSFETIEDIKSSKKGSPLSNFVWWAFNYKTGEVIKIE